MRMSVERDDPGYRPGETMWYEVWFNGEQLGDCVTADEGKGMVTRITAWDENGESITEDFYGEVEVRYVGPER